MSWKRILLGVGVVAVIALIVIVLRPEPLAVELAQMQTGPMQVTVEDEGETRSHDRFVISAPVSGRLLRLDLHAGDHLAENELVAQIAPLPLSLRERDELTARVTLAESLQREAAQLALSAEQDLAQALREQQRVRTLHQQGFMAAQAMERAGQLASTASIAAEAARFRLKAAAAEVRVARSGLGSASPGHRGDLALVQVRSPMAGQILRLHEESERVLPAGTPILTLGDVNKMELVIELLSSEAVKVKPGMPVLVEGWGGDQALRATVRLIEPYAVTKVSALGIEEKRTNVIADFVGPSGPLGDGYRITARIVVWQNPQVLKAPVSALFRCDASWCAYVVDQGVARRRVVEIGQRNQLEAQVLSGLAAGQAVIRYPANTVRDGTRVRAP